MQWKMMGALMLLAMSASTALLQDAAVPAEDLTGPAPEVIMYEPATGALYSVTAEGTQSLADMPDLVPFAEPSAYDYKLSPDRTRLVFLKTETVKEVFSGNYYVVNIVTGECCIKLDPHDETMDDVFKAMFSPDGSQLAVAHYNARVTDKESPGQIVVYDLATGDVVARLKSGRIETPAYTALPAPGIMMHGWTEDGLLVSPTCVGCEPPLAGTAQVWNPVEDTVSAPMIPFGLQSQLLGNGETMEASFDDTFPHNPEAVGMGPVANVVTYAPAPADSTVPAPSQVIYFNPDNLYIHMAYWVADGQAVLIQHNQTKSYFQLSDENTLLLRDGTQVPLTILTSRPYVASTTDGWLMLDMITRHYVYYRLDGTTVEEIMLDKRYSGDPVAVETPSFGASVKSGSMFPVVTAP